MLFSIYRGHGVVLDLSRTWCCSPFIEDMVLFSIYQGHGAVLDLSRTGIVFAFLMLVYFSNLSTVFT